MYVSANSQGRVITPGSDDSSSNDRNNCDTMKRKGRASGNGIPSIICIFVMLQRDGSYDLIENSTKSICQSGCINIINIIYRVINI